MTHTTGDRSGHSAASVDDVLALDAAIDAVNRGASTDDELLQLFVKARQEIERTTPAPPVFTDSFIAQLGFPAANAAAATGAASLLDSAATAEDTVVLGAGAPGAAVPLRSGASRRWMHRTVIGGMSLTGVLIAGGIGAALTVGTVGYTKFGDLFTRNSVTTTPAPTGTAPATGTLMPAPGDSTTVEVTTSVSEPESAEPTAGEATDAPAPGDAEEKADGKPGEREPKDAAKEPKESGAATASASASATATNSAPASAPAATRGEAPADPFSGLPWAPEFGGDGLNSPGSPLNPILDPNDPFGIPGWSGTQEPTDAPRNGATTGTKSGQAAAGAQQQAPQGATGTASDAGTGRNLFPKIVGREELLNTLNPSGATGDAAQAPEAAAAGAQADEEGLQYGGSLSVLPWLQ